MSKAGYRKPEESKYMPRVEISALLYEAHLQRNVKGYLMFATQYLLGLRIGEVIMLRYDHLGPLDSRGWPEFVMVPTLKKDKEETGGKIPLMPVPVLSHPELVMAAFNRQYRQKEGERKSPWLFPGRSPSVHISRTQAIEIFHDLKRGAGLRDFYTPHVLRHSAGTHLYEKCERMAIVTRFLRHRLGSGFSAQDGSNTTPRYVHMTREGWLKLRGALDLPKFAPLPRR